jgi:hypothetical protein
VMVDKPIKRAITESVRRRGQRARHEITGALRVEVGHAEGFVRPSGRIGVSRDTGLIAEITQELGRSGDGFAPWSRAGSEHAGAGKSLLEKLPRDREERTGQRETTRSPFTGPQPPN